ncbi:MAG: UDP-N-acetylmuramate dehydrogenase [Candidatus Saccharimonadales bacterium]
MDTHTNASLRDYLTMKLGGQVSVIVDAISADEVRTAYQQAILAKKHVFILGGGSNTLAKDSGFSGIVIRPQIKGITQISEDDSSLTVRAGAGEVWDDLVKWSIDKNLSGIEALSAIPGSVGAAPVQNIGAYGQEISTIFVELEAYDTNTDSFVTLPKENCEFSYRHSIFRGHETDRYIILTVTFRLLKALPQPPFYATLQVYLDTHGIVEFTPQVIRESVSAIRADKLPDPLKQPNTGSFFKNAIVNHATLQRIQADYPDAPYHEMPNSSYKIPTGWLIEQAGLRGQLLHGMRVYSKNALVLVNESANSYNDLMIARAEIVTAVRQKFGITIEQEPLEIPAL